MLTCMANVGWAATCLWPSQSVETVVEVAEVQLGVLLVRRRPRIECGQLAARRGRSGAGVEADDSRHAQKVELAVDGPEPGAEVGLVTGREARWLDECAHALVAKVLGDVARLLR